MIYDNTTHGVGALYRCLGGRLLTIAGAILFAIVIVQGESWALQYAPLLPTDSATAMSTSAGCLSDGSAAAGALPVAILH